MLTETAQAGRPLSSRDEEALGALPSWRRVFPGELGQMRVLRRWIEDLLPMPRGG